MPWSSLSNSFAVFQSFFTFSSTLFCGPVKTLWRLRRLISHLFEPFVFPIYTSWLAWQVLPILQLPRKAMSWRMTGSLKWSPGKVHFSTALGARFLWRLRSFSQWKMRINFGCISLLHSSPRELEGTYELNYHNNPALMCHNRQKYSQKPMAEMLKKIVRVI